MKILFFLSRKVSSEYSSDFMLNLHDHLREHHVVKIEHTANKVAWSDWDMILTNTSRSLLKVERKVADTNIPVVFISCEDQWGHKPFEFRNLLKVFSLHHGIYDFISPEIISYLHKPVLLSAKKKSRSKNKKDSATKILFFASDDPHARDLAAVIQFANSHSEIFNFTILVNKERLDTINHWINPTVILKDSHAFSTELRENYDLAFASGYACTVCLVCGLTTMVVGRRGYGGLVTSSNLNEFIISNFQGRIGGEIGEDVPYWILNDEMENFLLGKEETDNDTEHLARTCANIYAPQQAFDHIEKELISLFRLVGKIDSPAEQLRPIVSPGMQIIRSNQSLYLTKNGGRFLASISDAEKVVIEQCNGVNTLAVISKMLQVDPQEMGAFITELWFNKIVLLT